MNLIVNEILDTPLFRKTHQISVKISICYFRKVIAIAVIIKTFINGRKKNIEDLKPAVHISTSQKPSNRTTLKSVKRDESEGKRTFSSASKSITYMQKKPSVTVSPIKTQLKSSAENSQQKTQKIKSQGARQPIVKQSKQAATAKPTTKPQMSKQATTKTQKVTEKTKTLTRKSRKNV